MFGIDQHLGFALDALLDVEHALVLQAVVLAEEEVVALARRRRVLRVVVEVLAAASVSCARNGIFSRYANVTLFCASTHAWSRRVVVLEPAIRVRHLRAVIGVDVIDGPGDRVLQSALGGSRRGQGHSNKRGTQSFPHGRDYRVRAARGRRWGRRSWCPAPSRAETVPGTERQWPSRICFSLARSFWLALFIAPAIIGASSLENPDGSPRLRSVMRV